MSASKTLKLVKVLIVVSVLVSATFTQNLWAKEERSKGNHSQNNTPAQKVEKTARQERTESSPAPAQPTIREAPRGAPVTRQMASPATQPVVQQPQRQITLPTVRRADIARPQTKIIASSPNPQPTPSIQQSVTVESTRKTTQSRNIFRNPTTPSGVEVRQLSNTNPPDKSRIIAQTPDTIIRGKTNVSSPPAVIVERPGNSKGETGKSINTDKSSGIKTITTESLRADSKPARERNKAEWAVDPGKTSSIAKPIVQTAPMASTEPARADTKPAKAAEADRKHFARNPGKDSRPAADTTNDSVRPNNAKPDDSAVKERGVRQRPDKNEAKDKNAITGDSRDKILTKGRDIKSGTSKEHQLLDKDRSINASVKRNFITSPRNTLIIGKGDHDFKRFRPATTRKVIYEDRSYIVSRKFHHDDIYRDRHNRLCFRIIQPSFYYPVCYDWGRHTIVHYVYPYYCHRFVFVSLGGYWPEYTCVRYYWYPVHSYWWYGYAPIAQQVGGDTYNYYTYNYYNTQPAAAGTDYSQPAASTEYSNDATGITPVNADTFADVREKLSRQQPAAPDEQTTADTYFDEGINAFEQGSFAEAEERFARAMGLAPEDMILPFAYGQALFAQGKYTQAAEILRLALQKSSPDKQGVYFPRGLYLDENTLMDQIDELAKQTENNPSDSDLQLLLGYQQLGIGETESAIVPLNKAKEDNKNSDAATMLLELAEKIKAGENQ
jgi:hypothetical protein